MTEVNGTDDQSQRRRALDPTRSFIVQAPAGSGKTELLIQRLLVLLAEVGQPEEILALTFTRKAAAEMKGRLIEALERGGDPTPPAEAHALLTWTLARRVLQHQADCGWSLLQSPARLQLQTIDSFSASLTRQMPWQTGFGDQPALVDEPDDLYREAAEQLLSRLERGGAGSAELGLLLRHLDNRATVVRDLLVAMLGRRDQWLRHLLGREPEAARELLQAGLARYVASVVEVAAAQLSLRQQAELHELACYAADIQAAAGTVATPLFVAASPPLGTDGDALPVWLEVAALVLTSSGEVRKTVNVNNGFPAGKDSALAAMKQRMLTLLAELAAVPATAVALRALRELPEAAYRAEQWSLLEALITLLPLAAAELEAVFSRRGAVDFIGVAAAARQALGNAEQPEELLLKCDSRLRHLLIDEFQDTSYGQYDLLQRLTAGWSVGDGRTLFLVGDPMQSIYRFREAEVGLYLHVRQHGLERVVLERLDLTANFRSQAGLVSWFNRVFPHLLPEREDPVRGAVPYLAAEAVRPALTPAAVTTTWFEDAQDEAEAEAVVQLIRATVNAAPDQTVAVLVRSRRHLRAIVARLNAAGVRFQAQDIDPLLQRPVVLDLYALTRALLHPADRVAWLSLLRAPWCGCELAELLRLCDNNKEQTIWELLNRDEAQGDLFLAAGSPEAARLERFRSVMTAALARRGRIPLRQLVASTWLALGGPTCCEAADLVDAERVLNLLEQLDIGGELPILDELPQRLEKLFAGIDPQATPAVQLMTIHKAKGLEFDTVILPGLGRSVRNEERTLLRWLEHPDYELLLAPLPAADQDEGDPTYNAIGRLLQEKADFEVMRLFYVAATRARRSLHLFGHLRRRRDGTLAPPPGSLLTSAWEIIAGAQDAVQPPSEEEVGATATPLLRRLPFDWRPPELAPAPTLPLLTARPVSHGAQTIMARPSLRSEFGRIVGSVVHQLLERIGRDGLGVWSPERLQTHRPEFSARLAAEGIPAHRLDDNIDKVIAALLATLHSRHGRWILATYAEQACELPLSGTLDGVRVHAVVDRTFVDGNERWVIDYKTSAPTRGESPKSFLQSESTAYREQILAYAALFRLLEPHRPVRCGLYFPLVDLWQEIAPDAGEHVPPSGDNFLFPGLFKVITGTSVS